MNIHAQVEHLQARHVGTGHADMNKHTWATNHHRDTIASIVSHANILDYLSIAKNQSSFRTRYELLQKMLQPCGPPMPATD